MSDDIAQIPLPPASGGWKAWFSWCLSIVAVGGAPAMLKIFVSKLKQRSSRKQAMQTRLDELDRTCLKKGEFELKMANLFEAVNEGRQEQKAGNARIENRVDYISARLDAHIDNRPFKAPFTATPSAERRDVA